MWVYVCFLILFLYAIVLTVLYALRRRQIALRTVVLRIAADRVVVLISVLVIILLIRAVLVWVIIARADIPESRKGVHVAL